jgi:hypothetical protein
MLTLTTGLCKKGNYSILWIPSLIKGLTYHHVVFFFPALSCSQTEGCRPHIRLPLLSMAITVQSLFIVLMTPAANGADPDGLVF